MIERFAGRFALLKPLGHGGMGEVYLARDLSTGAECALKRLPARAEPSDAEILRREFASLTRVRHPAVVRVYELGFSPDGRAFYTMEYVPGLTADRCLERGDWGSLAFVAAEVACALEALHRSGVVHGDLKPGNLLIVPGAAPDAPPASVRVFDFGLATIAGMPGRGHTGTPGFAAPEVVRGETPGIASDLYGLGATLYALACGRPAFTGDDVESLLQRQQASAPPSRPLEDAGAPPSFVQLVLRLMAPDARERPRDATEVRRELSRVHPAARRSLAQRLDTVVVVGRERSLAVLEALLTAEAKHRPIVIVAGEGGVGKSTLLADFTARASLAGSRLMAVPGATLVRPGALGPALLATCLTESASLDSARRPGRKDASAAWTSEARAWIERGQVGRDEVGACAAVAASALRSAASAGEGRRIAVLIDDADSIDALSFALLRRLVLEPNPLPVGWILARRGSAEPGDDERAIVEAGLAEVLELGPLSEDAVQRLVSARIGGEVPDSLLAFLWHRGGGHPGLTVELLRAAAQRHAVRETDSGIVVDADALGRLPMPESFEAGLLERLSALPEAPKRFADALAVFGHPVEAARARSVAGTDAAAGLELLATGLARRYGSLVGLAPLPIARALREALPAERRRDLHRAILAEPDLSARDRFEHWSALGETGRALAAAEEAFLAEPDPLLAGRAAELSEPIDSAGAAQWRERAGNLLADSGRFGQALGEYERALEIDSSPASRPERWHRLSLARLKMGQAQAVLADVERALAEASPSPWRARLSVSRAEALYMRGELESARRELEGALDLARDGADDFAEIAAARLLAYVHLAGGGSNAAEAMASRTEDAIARSGRMNEQARSLGLRAEIAQATRDFDGAETLYRNALEEARAGAQRSVAEELLTNLGVVLSQAGKWEGMREVYAEVLRDALEGGRARAAALATLNLAHADGMTGRPRLALRRARRACRLSRRHLPRLETSAWRALAHALRTGGRVRAARRAARRALDLAMESGLVYELDWSRIEYGRALAASGAWKDAEEVWDASLARERASGSVPLALLAAWAGRARVRQGDSAAALERLERGRAAIAEGPAPYARAWLEVLAAEIDLLRGDLSSARDHSDRALAGFRSLPCPADRAHAALDLAHFACARAGPVELPIGAWLDEAAATFERLGDRRHRARSLTLSLEWLRRSGAPATVGRERGLIRAVSDLLDSLADFRELTQRAMQLAVEQLDAERGVLLLADAETGRLVPQAEYGAVDATTRQDAVGYSRRVVQRVAESGGSLVIGDAPTDPGARSESIVNLRLRSIVCVPLYLRGAVVGAVYLDDSRRPRAFSDEDRGLLEGFAQLLAVAIEESRGHDEVRRANEQLVGENLSLRQEANARFQTHRLIGSSHEMQKVLAVLERAANTASTVLLTGENGTGKELIARILHHAGKRRQRPFVAVNCGAIPETLLESELFGILPNVATGVGGRDGRFVQANGGTLFLDEIGEMPLNQQVALLSVISNREIVPVGGGKPIRVDVRIIAATNQDLRQRIRDKLFREDLYYRLNVIPIELPPLRERKADIPTLAQHFVAHFAKHLEREVPQLSAEFMAALMQSDWPGNVRELQNYVERVMAMTPGRILYPNPMPRDLEERGPALRLRRNGRLNEMIAELERRLVQEALTRARGNQSLAARELGIPEQTIRYRIRKLGIISTRENLRTRIKWR